MNKRKLLSLILAICMVMSLVPTIAFAEGGTSTVQIEVKNAQSGNTKYKVDNGEWIELNESKTYSIDGIGNGAQITISANPNEGQALDMNHTEFKVDGFQEEIDREALKTDVGWSFTYSEEKSYQVCVEYLAGGGDNPGNPNPGGGENPDNPDGNALSIELSGSISVSGGTFTYDHGTARVMFVRGNSEGAYDGSENRITLNDDVTAVKIILTAEDGYQSNLATGGDNPHVSDPVVQDGTSTYTFTRDALETAGPFIGFNVEFIDVSGGDDPAPEWYTISWSGGNVTVENGEVLAERVHVAANGDEPAKTYTMIESEYAADENDTIYSLWDTIGASKEELGGEKDALQMFGLSFSQSDLFIAKDMGGVSIDYKFIPRYGYQLKNIYTNEEQENSFLDAFTTDDENVSTFNFAVKEVNQNTHFCVYFEAVSDIFDVSGAKSVTGAFIDNGENATDSGNLKMTVEDIQEDDVSEELKARAGENALYLDMNLYQIVSKGGENGNWESQLTDLDNTITVTLSVPAPAKGSSYYIVREHGDGADRTYSRIEVTFVPDEKDPAMGTVTFETDKFSSYALAQSTSAPVNEIKNEIKNESEKIVETPTVSEDWVTALPDMASEADAVKLTVADTTVTNEVKDALASEAGVTPNADKSFYLNIDMKATVNGEDVPITNLNEDVTITLKVPEIDSNEEYTVVREHKDGSNVSYDKLESEYDRETGELKFKTKKFSVYAVLVSTKTNIKPETPPSYSISDGANAVWTKNTDGTLTIRADGEFSKFTGVKVDNTLIDEKNYTAVSGSTIVSLKADYLNTLSVGAHTIAIVYTDGECSTNFEVKKTSSEQTNPSEPTKPAEEDTSDITRPTGDKDIASPQTGDNNNLELWFALLFVSGAGLFGTIVYGRKKRYSAE